jgi:hypothetical protein
LGDRIRRESEDKPDDQVRRAFQLALGRPPQSREQTAAAAFVTQHGLTAHCRELRVLAKCAVG